jgi:hypothetical protein
MMVLRAIYQDKGAVTAATLAHSSHLTLDDAEATLRHLAHRGHLTPELADSGVMVYTLGLPDGRADFTTAKSQNSDRKCDASSMGLKQIATLRKAISVAAGAMIVGLFFLSVYLTLFAPRIWPQH